MTTELEQKIAEQAAVIKKLKNCYSMHTGELYADVARADVLATWEVVSTGSKQVLAEWLDKVLGEPFAYVSKRDPSFVTTSVRMSKRWVYSGFGIEPLFKKPEIK